MKRWEILKSIFELVSMHFECPTMISNTKRNLVSSRASRKVDEGGNGKNDNDLHIMVSFVTKRDININIFRTTFNHPKICNKYIQTRCGHIVRDFESEEKTRRNTQF